MRILLVEDSEDDAVLIHELLADAPGGPYEIDWVEQLSAAKDHFRAAACDVVLLDLSLPDSHGLTTVDRMQQAAPEAPIVVLTGLDDETLALAAVQHGAQDYLVKGHSTPGVLTRVLRYAVERKDAERALRESKERFRAITENASDVVAVLDPEGVVRFISPSIERILGHSPGSILGANALDCVHPDDRGPGLAALAALAESPSSPFPASFRVRAADGAWRWLEVTGRNLLSDVAVNGIVVNARDVTDRHRAQEAAETQLARLDLLNRLTCAIAERQDLESMFRVLLSRLETSLVIDGCAIYTYDSEAGSLSLAVSCGHMEQDGLPPPPGKACLRMCLAGQSICIDDFAKYADCGMEQLTSVGLQSGIATPLQADDRLYGILVAARHQVDGFAADEVEFLRRLGEHIALAIRHALLLQALQSAYEELQRTQQTAMEQERLRVLGQMASGIAHDINNSLMPITTYAELLALRAPELGERGKRYLKSILMAADDIKKTVGRMRELYRKRDERDEVRSVHIARLMRDVLDLTRPRWHDLPQQQGVTIDVKTAVSGAPTHLVAAESELREALTNLVGNAVDAMPTGGSISLRAKAWSESLVAIEVSDTGAGMDEETRRRCLDPFYTTKGEGGTGLGLSMVHGIVQRHDGTMEIDSRPDEGTTVRLILPIRHALAARGETAGAEQTPSRPLRVLCIDDDPRVRGAIIDMLATDGHAAEGAPGGKEGIVLFRTAQGRGEPFDVVLTDLGMPNVDGRMVALAVKAERPDIPVVLLTGWGTFMEPDALPEGVDAILGKPPELDALRLVFAQLTHGTLCGPSSVSSLGEQVCGPSA